MSAVTDIFSVFIGNFEIEFKLYTLNFKYYGTKNCTEQNYC